jgi:predicted RNA-binding Zn ribbon-like protein
VKSLAELPFVAGEVALDFVNTAEERGHPQAGDALQSAGDLRLWGQRYGLLSRSLRLPRDAGAELTRAREARELLYGLFLRTSHERAPRRDDLRRLHELATQAYEAASLRVGADGRIGWHWSQSDLSTVRHLAVTNALRLLQDASPRLKQCPGDQCGWFFMDRTKRGNRRWCKMSECGQEAKTERRRQRLAG